MEGIAGGNLEVRKFDVVHDEPSDGPYDLIAIPALLHHLPERRAVVSKAACWLEPSGHLFIHEPDFYPTWTVEPQSQKHFWEQFIQWAAARQIDYYVGRKIPAWLQAEGLVISTPKVMPFSTTAARNLRNGGNMGSAKLRTSCKPTAAYPKRHSTSSSLLSRPDLLDDNDCVHSNNRTALECSLKRLSGGGDVRCASVACAVVGLRSRMR